MRFPKFQVRLRTFVFLIVPCIAFTVACYRYVHQNDEVRELIRSRGVEYSLDNIAYPHVNKGHLWQASTTNAEHSIWDSIFPESFLHEIRCLGMVDVRLDEPLNSALALQQKTIQLHAYYAKFDALNNSFIDELQELEVLSLRHTKLPKTIDLTKMSKLKELELNSCDLSQTMIQLPTTAKFDVVKLAYSRLSNCNGEFLSQIKTVELSFYHTNITDFEFASLRSSQVEELDLTGTRVTKQSCEVLSTITGLRVVNLSRDNPDVREFADYIQNNLPHVKFVLIP